MKVLLVSAASSVHTMRWANAFVQHGLIVHLASQHDPVAGFDPAVRLHRLPHFGGLGYWLNRSALKRIIAEVRPDVVNAHYASGYGTLAVRTPQAPLVLNVWGSDVYEFPDTSAWHRRLLRRNLRRADAIVSTSHVMAERTAAVCPGLGPITVVPFGVDVKKFAPTSRQQRDPIVVGTVKTLAEKYGIDTLIEAFSLVIERAPSLPMRLRIVGGGPQRGALEKLAASKGIGAQVDFIGSVPHTSVPAELNALDVYVALSRTPSESFGVAVIEASACALPVVVADVGGLPEVVQQDRTGRIVAPDDPAAAAEAILGLVHSPEMRASMGAAGREHVLRAYEWGACVQQQLAVYRTAIERFKS